MKGTLFLFFVFFCHFRPFVLSLLSFLCKEGYQRQILRVSAQGWQRRIFRVLCTYIHHKNELRVYSNDDHDFCGQRSLPAGHPVGVCKMEWTHPHTRKGTNMSNF